MKNKKKFSLIAVMLLLGFAMWAVLPLPSNAYVETTRPVANDGKIYNITTTSVALYKNAGSSKLTSLGKDTIVTKLGTKGSYTYVDNGKYKGYVLTKYLKTYTPPAPAKVYNVTTSKTNLNKNAGSGKISTLNKGAIVTKLGTYKSYTYVESGNYKGYIASKDLKEYKIPQTTFQIQKPSKPDPTPTTTYTGSQVKQKLYGLGFFDKGSGVVYNIHGQGALDNYDYLSFSVSSGDKDMVLAIFNSNPEVDQKIRTTLSYILPSEGGRLYSILDNPSLKSQTLTMEGRTVTISIQSYGIKILFSPIAK